MHRHLLLVSVSAAALFAGSTAASAADQADTWTGFYGGVEVGYLGVNTTATDLDGAFDTAGTGTSKNSPAVIGGVDAGFNKQWGAIVGGVEADFSGSSLDSTVPWAPDPSGGTLSTRLSTLGTIRARLGVAAGRTLIYASGGVALGNLRDTVADNSGDSASVSRNTGYIVGGGVEQAITPKISVKIEAFYSDFGTATANSQPTTGYQFRFKNTAAIVRTGVNFRF